MPVTWAPLRAAKVAASDSLGDSLGAARVCMLLVGSACGSGQDEEDLCAEGCHGAGEGGGDDAAHPGGWGDPGADDENGQGECQQSECGDAHVEEAQSCHGMSFLVVGIVSLVEKERDEEHGYDLQGREVKVHVKLLGSVQIQPCWWAARAAAWRLEASSFVMASER